MARVPDTTQPRATLKDIAARAEVSVTAASLALRGQPGVSARTRTQILAAAEELGYISAGRGPQHDRKTVGVLLRDIVSVFSHDVVAGIQQVTDEHDIRLVVADGRGDDETIRAEFEKLAQQPLHGLVVFGTAVTDTALRSCAERMPVVVIGRMGRPVRGVDIVSNDDFQGAKIAVQHLLHQGHSRIAHLSKGLLRRDGFVAQMREAGLELHAQVEGGTPELLKPAIRYILFSVLHEKNSPTAVFAETDGIAIDLIGAALDAGLRVPEDLSVVGYDSTRQCDMIRPRLTSVGQPRHEMGQAAIELLRNRWAGETEDKHIMLEPSLEIRESTSVPRFSDPDSPLDLSAGVKAAGQDR